MPKKTSEEDFIAVWRRLRSPTKVAEAINGSVREVLARRRRIEARLGISLETDNPTISATGPSAKGQVLANLAAKRQQQYQRDMGATITHGVIIVASDCHYWPGMVSVAHTALLKLASALKPDMVVLNGDVLDGARISRHARIMWEKQPTLKDELHAVQDRCAEIERAARGAKCYRTIGNHDARFENYLSTNVPEMEEMAGATLLDYLPAWEAGWALHLNAGTDGWTTIRHRPVSGGIHSAYNSTLRSGVNYVHGHLHKLQVTPWADYRGRRYGIDTGTLAEPTGPQFNYTEAGPLNWASGFAVLTFHNGRLLEPELCVAQGGVAYFRGKPV